MNSIEEKDSLVEYLVSRAAFSQRNAIEIGSIPEKLRRDLDRLMKYGIVIIDDDRIYLNPKILKKSLRRFLFHKYKKTIMIKTISLVLISWLVTLTLCLTIVRLAPNESILFSLIVSLSVLAMALASILRTFFM